MDYEEGEMDEATARWDGEGMREVLDNGETEIKWDKMPWGNYEYVGFWMR